MLQRIGILFIFSLFISTVYSQNKASEKAYKKAISYFNKGQAVEGFDYLQKALKADSTHKKALYALGYYQFQAQKYDSARMAFDRLIVHYPKDTSFYHYRALTRLYTEDYTGAEKDFQHVLSIDPKDETAWNDLGYLYYQWGKEKEANEALDRSISVRPSRSAWYYKALLAYEQDEKGKAKDYVQKALVLDPAYPNALRLNATLLAEDKKYPEAVKIYEGLLQAGEIEDEDFLDWGMIYYRQKKYEDALYYFDLPDSTDNVNLLYYKGLTQYRLKKYPEALTSLNQATQELDSEAEENAPILYDLAIVKFQAGSRKEAVEDFLHSIYLMPEIAQQRNQVGDTLELLGNAVLLLNRLYTPGQLDSVRIMGYYDRADALVEDGDIGEDALHSINQAISLDTLGSNAYFLRARIYYFQEKYAEALRDMNKVFLLKKNTLKSYEHYWRGLVYSAMDAFDNALTDYNKAIQLEPSESTYYADRALVLSAIGENSSALQDINQAMQLEKENDHTYLILIRASLLNDEGQYEQAIRDCDTVITAQPENALAYCMRGFAHKGLRQTPKALADFTKALSLEPDMEEAKAGLEDLDGQ
ncbi:tetratricopeptide repeat protein [Xanthocytophaga agilis]|uniref:Tetratricopeptide repeat protein n=1 Tax=Xanthocytophaga agilis TaxID=3048010 RepID=A0AAE3R023_9BACT|nr:tetratricopeptide repeat protein [Xanthocytophaga agilis]MDJ1499219.1 tetratricopeptide repeat protein [Xanthocytophaga agilis]